MNEDYMEIAYQEAIKAKNNGEVPVGAVIVLNGQIISKSYNQKVSLNNICAHAEIIAINDASKKMNDWRLVDCDMYVTLEPCPMCAGAIQQSRIKNVFIGTKSNFESNNRLIKEIFDNKEFYHRVNYEYVNDKRCCNILKEFFSTVRDNKK